MKLKLGLVSSVFVHYSLEETVLQAARLGFQGIDLWGGRPHLYRSDHSPRELRLLRKMMDDNNLHLISVLPAFLRYPHSLSTPNEIARADSLEYMRMCLEHAITLGTKIVAIVPGHALHDQPLADARRRLVDSIAQISLWAAPLGIKLGIEPANRVATMLINNSKDALQVVREVGAGNLGVILDTGHLNLIPERPEMEVAKLGRLLLQMHVNDNDGRRQQNLIPGEGTFPFARFMRFLIGSGFEGFLSAELGWDYTADPVAASQLALQRMRGYLQLAVEGGSALNAEDHHGGGGRGRKED